MTQTTTRVCWTAAGPPVSFMADHLDDSALLYDDERNSRFLFLLPVKEDLKHSKPHIQQSRKGDGIVLEYKGWCLFLRIIGHCSQPGACGPWKIPVSASYVLEDAAAGRCQTKSVVRRACESIQEGTVLEAWSGSPIAWPLWEQTRTT